MTFETPPLILVVDDNEMNRDMLSRRLERQGYQTVTAEDGEQALTLIPQHGFDLILLDIMMPRLNGYEVLQQLKADPRQRHIPVIMISAVDDLDSVVRCIELGAEDYLFKPFNPILLKARISASLEKKRLRDREQRAFASRLPAPLAALVERGEGVPVQTTTGLVFCAALSGLDALPPEAAAAALAAGYAALEKLCAAHQLHIVRASSALLLAVGGIPGTNDDPANAAALALACFAAAQDIGLGARLGITLGPVQAGLVGQPPRYDVWGEALNAACHLCLTAPANSALLNAAAAQRLPGQAGAEPHSIFTGIEGYLLGG
jgi:CheY-like chemotaxis protein